MGKESQKMTGRSVSSTEAQNNFGAILERVSAEGRVFITRYERRQAVVLSMAEYEALSGEEAVDLGALEAEFDAMMEAMQGEEHRAGVDALFAMSSEQLGEAAIEATRRED